MHGMTKSVWPSYNKKKCLRSEKSTLLAKPKVLKNTYLFDLKAPTDPNINKIFRISTVIMTKMLDFKLFLTKSRCTDILNNHDLLD